MTNTNQTSKITILGIGNSIFTDEGIGIHILPHVEKALLENNLENVIVHEGATDGMALLDVIEDCDHLLIIDAINAGKEPGTLITLNAQEIPQYFGVKMSVHQVGFQEVLFAARIRGKLPEHMCMIGVQPKTIQLGLELTEPVKESYPALVDAIITQVKDWRD